MAVLLLRLEYISGGNTFDSSGYKDGRCKNMLDLILLISSSSPAHYAVDAIVECKFQDVSSLVQYISNQLAEETRVMHHVHTLKNRQ